MLIDHFGDTICLTYLKDRQKLQMFYLTDMKCIDVAEKLRSEDTIRVCAELLRDEYYKFKFHLEGTYNSAGDCNISYETYTASRLQSCERFFNILFLHWTKSVKIQRKCDYISDYPVCYTKWKETSFVLCRIGWIVSWWFQSEVGDRDLEQNLFLRQLRWASKD